jgi:replicative DNA helicase
MVRRLTGFDSHPEAAEQRRNGRVPPHNIEAEESFLGAMLLSKDAIATAVETVTADDSYKPAHAHVFEAIVTLYGAGQPVDPTTVADHALLRTGQIPEDDWSRISGAVGRLAGAPLFIHDNPHLTVMDMRAKCRRLKATHGDLGLVVVDYLQLMSTGVRVMWSASSTGTTPTTPTQPTRGWPRSSSPSTATARPSRSDRASWTT